MSRGLGLKRKIRQLKIGRKLKRAEKIGRKIGKDLEVGARKAGNVARRVGKGVDSVSPYLKGTPLAVVATGVKGLAKGVEAGSKGARRAGRELEKISRKDLAEKADEKLSKFV